MGTSYLGPVWRNGKVLTMPILLDDKLCTGAEEPAVGVCGVCVGAFGRFFASCEPAGRLGTAGALLPAVIHDGRDPPRKAFSVRFDVATCAWSNAIAAGGGLGGCECGPWDGSGIGGVMA